MTYPPHLAARLHRYPKRICRGCGKEIMPRTEHDPNSHQDIRLESRARFSARSSCGNRCSARMGGKKRAQQANQRRERQAQNEASLTPQQKANLYRIPLRIRRALQAALKHHDPEMIKAFSDNELYGPASPESPLGP